MAKSTIGEGTNAVADTPNNVESKLIGLTSEQVHDQDISERDLLAGLGLETC